MTLISTDTLRELIDTDLSDDALQVYLDAAAADIDSRYGECTDDGVVTVVAHPSEGDEWVFLRAPVDLEEAIVITRAVDGQAAADVTTNEYVVSRRRVRILGYAWPRTAVVVTYTALGEVARRRRVLVDLVKLGLRYEAAGATRMGDAQVTHVDYQAEREALLSALETGTGSFA